MGVGRRIRTGPAGYADRGAREEAGGRGNAATAAVAVALLIALLFVLPFLQFRLDDAGQRLHALLRKEAAQRAKAEERLDALRVDLQRRVGETSRSQEDALEFIEDRLDRIHPRPRPVSEVHLSETPPLPHEVAPAVQPHGPTPEPKPAVAGAGQDEAAQPLEDWAEKAVAWWVQELDDKLRFSVQQRARCTGVLEEYQRQILARRDRIVKTHEAVPMEEFRTLRSTTIQQIEGLLTAEQLATYRDLEQVPTPGSVIQNPCPPLPGTNYPRTH